MTRKTKSALLALCVLLLACASAATWFGAGRIGTSGVASFITARATKQTLERTVLASGTLEPARLVNVGARASGQVMKLHVKVGNSVRAGQLIAEIDSAPQRNTLSNAEASLEGVQAQRQSRSVSLRQAELVLTRQRNLLAADATSRDAYETALAARDVLVAENASLDAQIRQAAAAVQTARTDLGYTRIVAPIDGVVVAVVTEEGRTLNAFQSAPTIVMIAELDVMKVRAEISEADVMHVKTGKRVYFTVLGEPSKRYHATLQSIEPAPASIATQAQQSSMGANAQASAATKTAVYYNALFEMPNPDGELRPMMTAQVHIVLDRIEQALVIPMTSLGPPQSDGTRAVRVLDARGQAAARTVRVGLSNGVLAQVIAGLEAGEQVVIGDATQAIHGGSSWGAR